VDVLVPLLLLLGLYPLCVWIKDKFGEVKRNNELEKKRVLDLLADKIIDIQLQYHMTNMKNDVTTIIIEKIALELLHEEARLAEPFNDEVLTSQLAHNEQSESGIKEVEMVWAT
jgi:hypothetical protein